MNMLGQVRNNKVNTVMAFLLWACALLIMFMSKEYLSDSLYMAAAVFVAGGVLFFTSRDSFLTRFLGSDKKRRLLWIPILAFCFLLALSWHRMFANPLWDIYLELGTVRRLFVYVFLFVIIPFGIIVSMSEILDRTLDFATRSFRSNDGKTGYLGSFAILAVIGLVFIFAAYPGLSEPDGWGIWDWVHTGVYDEWHTIGYLFLVKVCSFIWDSLFCVEMAHLLLYLIVSLRAMQILSEHYSAKGLGLYVLFSVIAFSPLMNLQGMNKDTPFNIALFGACVSIYLLLYSENVRVWDIVFSVVFFLGVTIFRHAGLMICVITLVLLLIHFAGKRRFDRAKLTGILLATSSVGYFLIVVLLGRWTLHAIPNPPYIKYTVPMYMMGAMAADDEVELTAEQQEAYALFAPVETWADAYDKYNADPVSRDWGTVVADPTPVPESEYGPAFLRTNAQLVVRHPVKYISNYLDITSILWEIARPQDGLEYALVEDFIGENNYLAYTETVKSNGFTAVIKAVSDFTARLPVYRSLVWRGGLAQFCYVVLIVLACRNKHKEIILVAVPIMVYYLSLYLSIPQQITRYVIGAIEILPFFAGVCFSRCTYDKGN